MDPEYFGEILKQKILPNLDLEGNPIENGNGEKQSEIPIFNFFQNIQGNWCHFLPNCPSSPLIPVSKQSI